MSDCQHPAAYLVRYVVWRMDSPLGLEPLAQLVDPADELLGHVHLPRTRFPCARGAAQLRRGGRAPVLRTARCRGGRRRCGGRRGDSARQQQLSGVVDVAAGLFKR